MKRVSLFSGGKGSLCASKRVAERHGTDDLILLFTDTRSEDVDTYRYLREGAAAVGGELVWLDQGKDVWDVFFEEGMMGSTRADPCSRILKREPARRWIEGNCDPADTTVYVGIDWSEAHRFRRMERYWAPYRVEAPMTEAPYMTSADMVAWAEAMGVRNQRLYELGARHANCGGACVKGGHAAWAWTLRNLPEVYERWEANEKRFREWKGKDVSILRNRRQGMKTTLPLTEFRKRMESQEPIDEMDWGSCACVEPGEGEL